ncbi:uncharacterized protein F5147DRAFT_657119 [Suillus discolor]|uniref:Uncharacterized protein n=1 Tax=Suillus discolor TaxID=1912936 RepID=A0A9P7JP44_9AGAM|nr:uncharacterized protein F5147DRAFT_657119 [Suillus discolor]KAG2094643.1 hypothetical protein F5147DRAFT_657119 [Suillus discolor]
MSKLRFLKILSSKLHARGYRLVSFFMGPDIIEDFMRGEGYKYYRLYSTGQVGINLHTADTVLTFDPDFNPHQAIAHSHRYRQMKTCLVFKFTVKYLAEEDSAGEVLVAPSGWGDVTIKLRFFACSGTASR